MIQLPSGGRKRTRTSRRFRSAHCFRNRSETLLGFPSNAVDKYRSDCRRIGSLWEPTCPASPVSRLRPSRSAPYSPRRALGVWHYLRTVMVTCSRACIRRLPAIGASFRQSWQTPFLGAEERGLAPRTRQTGCRPFSRRRRTLCSMAPPGGRWRSRSPHSGCRARRLPSELHPRWIHLPSGPV